MSYGPGELAEQGKPSLNDALAAALGRESAHNMAAGATQQSISGDMGSPVAAMLTGVPVQQNDGINLGAVVSKPAEKPKSTAHKWVGPSLLVVGVLVLLWSMKS